MRNTAISLTALGLMAFGWTAMAEAATPVTKVSVDTTKPGATIDRHIFGQFAEHLGTGIYGGIWVGKDSPIPNTRGIRNDVVTALKALHVPNVRWPGGCFADEYHWQKGIGTGKRPVTLNSNWGGVLEPNTFGTDEFMDFVSQIDSEAYISANVGSSTPQETAEWLEYMTSEKETSLAMARRENGHPAPYSIAFLGIGNESWGCGGNMTPEHYTDEFRQFTTYAKNYNPAQTGDKRMKKIASGANVDDYNWTETFMKNKGGEVDALSLHFYSGFEQWPPYQPASGFDETQYAKVIKTALRMEELVSKHSAIMDKYDPEKKVALAVDEWGAWYAQTPGSTSGFLVQQNSQRDAILAAVSINIFTRHADRVRMANIAQMINVLQAMILTDGDKMVLTPTYHVFKMYVPFQDSKAIPVSYDAGTYSHDGVTLPRADIVAAKGKDGKYYLSITNIDPDEPLEVDASILGFTPKKATGQTLVAPKIDSINTFDKPNLVVPKAFSATAKNCALTLKVAPESVTVVVLE
ncbi:alpha-N-arabinofuranosidase [Asticcacaulis sp. 201]|uniref:alpha-N-arabinofuranosidase n=1 Tax=Asticcacaulis sp. 201 TaxID=3028787 RepID=UPI002916939F|nr:alpha-L-arabinofuranosidase C-terminal domain-containing protein [Asticcacaulis sp. 201]MDV6333109.1 alpha-L-arabinofuranosidase C-terminal domain-containing protein [Asticcacaulis sp. 201]